MMSRRFVLLLLLVCPQVRAQTRVWQGTITLQGNQEGPPDPTPPSSGSYPYTMRNPVPGAPERKSWRTLEMENEFLHCTVLPDLGGRIYSCIDKIDKRDLFFANPVIKKRVAGPRGAEIAAGQEFECPVSPGLVTLSSVDFASRQDADGSVSVFIGNTGRDGTRWLVELVLRPHRALLEQRVTISNPDPVRHSYTWWERASVPIFEDTQFYLPAHFTTDARGGDGQPWDGKLTRAAAAQRFAYQSREGWFATYSAREGSGTSHYARPDVLPGKAFGYRGPEGIRDLTGDQSQFADMEPGLWNDKSGRSWLEPGQMHQFTEYWMPLRGLGGFSRANMDAAVFLGRGNDRVMLGLQVFRSIPNAKILVTESDQVLLQEQVSLDPAKTVTRTVAKGKRSGHLHFQLRDEKGAILLEHTESYFDAAPTIAKAAPVAAGAPADPATEALEQGRAALVENRFGEAVSLLERAAPIPETRLYLALALINEGEDARARPLLGKTPADRLFGVPARVESAKLLGRAGDRKNALAEVQAALRLRPLLAGGNALEVALLRANGMSDAAREKLGRLSSRDPADPLLQFEALKLGAPGEELWKHLAADPARVLQVAEFYLRAGLWADALDIVTHQYPEVPAQEREPGTALPQDDPLVSYLRGYTRTKMGASGREDFAMAAKQRVHYLFPNRVESIMALGAALRANPGDSTAHFLSGAFYVGSGAIEAGLREWRKAIQAGTDYPSLKNDVARLEASERNKPSKQTSPPERVNAKPAADGGASAKSPQGTAAVVTGSAEERAAAALIDLQRGRLQEAVEIFSAANFPKERQSEAVKTAFIEVRLQSILDLARRKRCGDMATRAEAIGDEDAAVPFSMYGFGSVLKTARVQYLLADAASSCGDDKTAKKLFDRAAKAGQRATGIEYAYAQLAANKLGASIRPDPAKFGKDAEGLLAAGLLEQASGHKAEAEAKFRTASAEAGGNAMLRYLCEMALAGH